ncbi:MAG TPA: hypothetical protein VM389_08615 [Phycisphaerae bacterium]|nr:hypothetical protein [Phycisphaerae bacterium]HUU22584.1 hypothetical protein [Phycisphaerae bacterium]
MSASEVTDALVEIPEGYAAVPIAADQARSMVRPCVLVRRSPDPVAGHLVVLRDLIDGRVLLGCLVDAAGFVQEWVELWFQDLEALSSTTAACREALTNEVLDRRWKGYFQAMVQADPASVVHTGWETRHPLPTYVDLASMEPIHPADPQSGGSWALCEDDGLLAAKGVPLYSTSLHRYLYLPGLGKESPLVPTTPDAPKNDQVLSPTEITGGRRGLLGLNTAGGLMLVRRHWPIRLEPFADVLSGGSWAGVFHGRGLVNLGPVTQALKGSDPALTGGGWLFLGRHGRWGRMVEGFHLKLRLIADAVRCVQRTVQTTQRPLLNLKADSFQVRLASPATGLPFLWTARAVLADPGDAVTLPIRASSVEYFLRSAGSGASVYQPESAGQAVRGRGTVRIRQVLPEGGGGTIVEGTLATQERFEVARYDLIWLRLNLASGRVDLYGQLEQASALAAGEWRFRTVGQRFGEDAVAALRSAEGVPIAETAFEIIPLLSSPCDLYGLAVLAVRTLLVNSQTALPVALDETLSLARQVAEEYDEQTALGLRVRQIFESDGRWAASLGPHRLTNEEMAPEEALDLIPAEVWFDTLGAIVRMFPGLGPDSLARDLGDAPPGGIHKVFDRAVEAIDDLVLRTRSLIVIDWRFNREVHAVVRQHLVGLGGGA